MRKLIALYVFFLLACDSKNALDCFQTNGPITQEEIQVADFTTIKVRDRIELVLKQGPETKLIIETGENIRNDISAVVEDGVLILRDANACNLFREYNVTKAFVTAPDINLIRNESGRTVTSDGVLSYPSLRLVAEDFTENDRINTDGDFNMDVQVDELELQTNNLANFFIRGTASKANIRIFSGDSRVEAQGLVVQELTIYHRGTNQMFVTPIQSIQGEIRSVGDVVATNQPPVVEVAEFYTGRLIFQD